MDNPAVAAVKGVQLAVAEGEILHDFVGVFVAGLGGGELLEAPLQVAVRLNVDLTGFYLVE